MVNVNENITKDGRWVWVNWMNKSLIDVNGHHIGHLAIGNDVTEQKQAEAGISRRSEMLDLAHDAIIIRDVNDCITYWNRGAERLYGWKEEEDLGMITHELFQTVFPELLDVIMQALHRDGAWDRELMHTARDNVHIVVDSHWTLYRDSDGKPSAIFEINNDLPSGSGQRRSLQKTNRSIVTSSRIQTASSSKLTPLA